MSEETTAVEKAVKTQVVEKTNWQKLHGSWRERIERMLPDAKMIDQFMYAAECQYGKNKAAFDKCTPISLLNCLLTCSRYGMLPDGRVAHLIPYGEECTVQFDYKGLIHVVVRDGVATKVYCEAICANDKFEFRDGKVTNHVIGLPRGAVLGAYCDITLPNGEHQFEIMDVDEINSVKACSRGSNSPSSPWNKFYKEMAKKSVFRRATKWLKLTPDVMDAVNADNEGFDFEQGAAHNRRSAGLFPKEVMVEASKEDPPKKTVVEVQAERVEVEARKAEASQLPF